MLWTDAYMNWGRWVTDCGYPACRNAQLAEPGDQRMVCGRCASVSVVSWPEQVSQIEQVLGFRVALETRNWRAPETVADLERENTEHGVV